MSKLTAKEYLQEIDYFDFRLSISNKMLSELLEEFHALKVKEEKEDSETFEGWAVYNKDGQLCKHSIATTELEAKGGLINDFDMLAKRGSTINPITVTVKKKNHEK